jgi:hypothetical protein
MAEWLIFLSTSQLKLLAQAGQILNQIVDEGLCDEPQKNLMHRMLIECAGCWTSSRRRISVARFDNLGKGASGAAVQNLELMLGLNGVSPNAPQALPSARRQRRLWIGLPP